MYKELVQPWVTIEFSGAGEVIQSQEQWADTEGFSSGTAMMQVPWIDNQGDEDNLEVIAETSPSLDGPWERMDSGSSGTGPTAPDYAIIHYLSTNPDVPSTARFSRYIRWRIVARAAGVGLCFRSVLCLGN